MEDLFKQADKMGLKIAFGLEAQGHIPVIQAIIKKENDHFTENFPDEKPLDFTYEKRVWEKIGKQIGWEPFTASLEYFRWLEKQK